jgi:hypothetical protein
MPAGLGAANAWPVGRDLGSALVPGVTAVIADLISATSCDPSGMAALTLAHRKAAANSTKLRLAPHRVPGDARLEVGLGAATGGGHVRAVETKVPAEVQKFPLTTLIAMVVGSMVGAGIFSLPRNFALATGVYGALIAWAIAATGMLMLAFVFQTLAVRKPDLDAGVYAYAKAGFGEYLGFYTGWGYWASACVGNVTYWVLVMSTLGRLWPGVFGKGNTVTAFVLSSAGLWMILEPRAS